MYCVKCGAALPDGANFCPGCGKRIKRIAPNYGEIKTVQFRCKGCGHVMEIDPDSPVLRCSVCGSNELIQEDTDVTIERIRSRVKREENQTYRDVQTGWQRVREKEIDAQNIEATYQRNKKEIRSYRGMLIFTILLTFFYGILLCIALALKFTAAAAISIVGIVFCLLSILSGYKSIKGGRGLSVVLLILVFMLFFPYLYYSAEGNEQQKKNEIKAQTMIWPTTGTAEVLPAPTTNNGHISVNNDVAFSFYLYSLSKDEYHAYINDCIEKSFSIDSEWIGDEHYTAYNNDGYYLQADFIDLDPTQTWIRVDIPEEMKEISWPSTDMVNLLPKPEATIGSIETNREASFSVIVGDTTKEQYSQYVDSCIAAGFDKDYSRGNESFYGDHKKGYHLTVSYQGFNTIRITIKEESE